MELRKVYNFNFFIEQYIMEHCCYILANKENNRTYNGYTNNLKRRLRQHNQEIKGGAKYTKLSGNKTWFIIAYVTGFPDMRNALQCEWRIKHPDNKRRRGSKYLGAEGRIKGLNEVLKLNKWTENSTVDNTFDMTVYVLEEYVHLLTDLQENIKIVIQKKQI